MLQGADGTATPIKVTESSSTRGAPARRHIHREARRNSVREQWGEQGAAATHARAIANALALASAVDT
jgi:hypothetical protein